MDNARQPVDPRVHVTGLITHTERRAPVAGDPTVSLSIRSSTFSTAKRKDSSMAGYSDSAAYDEPGTRHAAIDMV
ncbi:hypothetical protein ABGB17_11085 [Sphaerisporangium sp. B11E5]|uniref:hypothetical protein n=1 Tax=Sphaerisporangium sp. B11E5 TaxID=3153563 RepID=UPI00325CB18C